MHISRSNACLRIYIYIHRYKYIYIYIYIYACISMCIYMYLGFGCSCKIDWAGVSMYPLIRVCSAEFKYLCVLCVCICKWEGGFTVSGLGFRIYVCSVVLSHMCILCVYLWMLKGWGFVIQEQCVLCCVRSYACIVYAYSLILLGGWGLRV